MLRSISLAIILSGSLVATAAAADGNRLAYLDGPLDPYYPHRDFPKLITPQWVGDEGVECVVTLAIDDMRDSAKYEAYLRPILERLKKIDGRAPVSIMSCRVNPDDLQLQTWLKEGLSIEVHTYDHPCPCLQDGGLVKAKETYDKCVDLMNQIPNNKPVAFRMPCCDSKNTPSPRFWAEVFNKTTEKGNFLQIDSSVFNIITNKDKDLPKEITELPDSTERFRRYVPFANFVNTIEDYPYPYIIGGMCWEFPCVVPSDWSAQHVQKPNNPDTVRDWKLALDACLVKQGTFNLVFHPHGWIKAEQIVELIDHAVEKHGKKVKFLTFKECSERLNRYTSGKQLRELPELKPFAAKDSRLRMVDVNADGRSDRLYSDHERYSLYLYSGQERDWTRKIFDVTRGKEDGSAPVIPPFVRADGTNNGAWFHSGALWLQNEDTWRLPDNVFKLTFAELLGKKELGRLPVKASGGREPAGMVASDGASHSEKSIVIGRLMPPARRDVAYQDPSSDARYDTLEMTRPLSPEESLKAMHVRPGMKVELVAAEPLIVDPVAFDWGPDGRLWVVEMRDYPSGITWNKEGDEFGKPGGRVKVLTDVDGDGRYDKAALFLDDLPFPTGIKVWRKGILVTAAPDILYAEDTDGDDKADKKQVLYRGFGEGNQQHRVNGLRWGLDNWLHVGNGDSGGVIKSLAPLRGPLAPRVEGVSRSETTTMEINVSGRDLRIRPDTGELEATSGNTQFGRETDDWGNWFGNNNSDPLWHYVLDDRYLRRNTHATYPPVKKQVASVPGAAPVYPKSQTLTRFNDDNKANRFTSACGPTIYRDDLLGPEFYGNSFVCEPVHNLVHREIIAPQGATFTSRRAEDEKTSEFLASEDSWFRPSMCRTGPDGALWVSDMYRFVVEHPKWIPLAAQKKLDLRAGDDKGRIYRIYPEGKQPRPIARLDKLDTAGLVAALDSPNGPQRDLAHQMLVWRGDKAAAEPLTKLLSASRPQVRLQALCTLDGLAAVTDELLLSLLADDHPAFRRHAVRLAEPRLDNSEELAAAVERLTTDADMHVRMQVAYLLGAWNSPRRAAALAAMLSAGAADPYLTAATLSSVAKDTIGDVLVAVFAASEVPAGTISDRLLTMAAAMGQDAAVGKTVAAILQRDGDAANKWTLIAGVTEALARRNVKLGSLLDERATTRLTQLLAAARTIVQNNDAALTARALDLLARGLDDHDPADMSLLAGLLGPQHAPEIRAAALTALARTANSEVPALLLAGWAAHSPTLRNQILDALSGREAWSLALLDAAEAGRIAPSQFDARRRQQLFTSRSSAVRQKAEKVLTAAAFDANRQKIVESYLSVATGAAGNPSQGKTAFAKRCANCHKLEGTGHAVGPDLAPLTHRPVDYLLTSILDPNRAVEDRYLEYVAQTTDGRQLSGILVEETGASLTLAAPEGKTIVVPRGELEQLKSSGKSLMPEGVERDVTPDEMRDLLAYLKTSAPPPKQLALNQPEIIQPFNDGSIRLFATNCRAYGPTIRMEETWRALGWWNSQDDHCAWTFEVPPGKGGDYRVTLEYSCDDNSAGNTAVIEANGQTLSGQVTSSGGWDRFRGWNLGSVKLTDGRGELVVRSSGPIKGALFDLGGIRLVPVK